MKQELSPSIEPSYPPQQDKTKAADKVVYIDFVAFRGKRKVKDRMAIRSDEMETVLGEKEKGTVQFSMFE